MKIGRTLPPAAAPLGWGDLRNALAGCLFPARALNAFERDIQRDFDVRHVFAVSSGTAALTLTLEGLKLLSRRTEVVIPAYTCFSVPAAVLKAGLRPVLCDVDACTFDFDHGLLERTLTDNTLCVIAHHLFGIPSDIERTRALCRARGAFAVEDAAQAMGAERDGRRLGTLGDAGIFSFGRGKQITCGSGGLVITNSDEIAVAIGRHYRRVRAPSAAGTLRELAQVAALSLLIRPRLYWIPAALPFLRLGETIFPRDITVRRLSGVKAGMLRNWRRRLIQGTRARSAAAAYFAERLPLRLAAGSSYPYLRLPILAATPADKQRIQSLSRARGLGLSGAYPLPVSEVPQMRALVNGQRFPTASKLARRLCTIPTHHWLSERDKRAIADLFRGMRP